MSRETSKGLRQLLFYQVYVRNYSESGTFKSLQNDLPRIKNLGVDVLYLLPIHPIGEVHRKGELGSPYSIQDYRKINQELGDLSDFQDLIDETHQLGMKIMMDVVYNHTSHDSLLAKHFPEYFYKRDGHFANKVGDWWDIIDLDLSHLSLQDELIDILLDYAKLGVDGFRFDVASLLPYDFLTRMKLVLKQYNPQLILLSESVHGGFCRYLRNQGFDCLSESEIYQIFDIAYDYDIHPLFEGYLKGELPFRGYLEGLIGQEEIYPENYVKLRNLENHDFGRFIQMIDGDLIKFKQWLALSFFSKGATMLYMGQEFASSHHPDLFNKDVMQPSKHDFSKDIRLMQSMVCQDICAYGQYDIIINDQEVFVGVYKYQGKQLVGIFNIGKSKGYIASPIPDGIYVNLITNHEIHVLDQQIELIDQPIFIQI